ncbi:low affinity iron permease family protein [Pleomorphomonas sp. PLEO]|uniref:low affinity iron permease family protein n=1 Tax=Pleomorphomonas sp. PLEO TaxID=3239306 RepID=UPI00351DECA8
MSRPTPSGLFARFASALSEWSGRPVTFALALALIVFWAISGPFFGFSAIWQLIINTLTSIVTLLLVFLLQSSQNRDGKALQAKIDELILSSKARNKFVGIERLDEDTLQEICATLPEPDKEECEDDVVARGAAPAASR